jgi:hypothetical protein
VRDLPPRPPPLRRRESDSHCHFHAGRTRFPVYARSQNPTLVPGPGGAVPDLQPVVRGQAAADVATLKLAYWWG